MFTSFRKISPKFFLSKKETEKLMDRVATFENATDCELVFHFRKKLGSHPTEFNQKLFYKFGLDKTNGKRAILITLALRDRQFSIWADEGVAIHTGDKLWLDVCSAMGKDLKAGHRLEALLHAVDIAQEHLKGIQPHRPDGLTNNEISNKPIISTDNDSDEDDA